MGDHPAASVPHAARSAARPVVRGASSPDSDAPPRATSPRAQPDAALALPALKPRADVTLLVPNVLSVTHWQRFFGGTLRLTAIPFPSTRPSNHADDRLEVGALALVDERGVRRDRRQGWGFSVVDWLGAQSTG